jgi:hypothetical protein
MARSHLIKGPRSEELFPSGAKALVFGLFTARLKRLRKKYSPRGNLTSAAKADIGN